MPLSPVSIVLALSPSNCTTALHLALVARVWPGPPLSSGHRNISLFFVYGST